VSYGYQFHPGYREWKTEQRQMYGDIVPVARCRHHVSLVLDLTCAFEVRDDLDGLWEAKPEVLETSFPTSKRRFEEGCPTVKRAFHQT